MHSPRDPPPLSVRVRTGAADGEEGGATEAAGGGSGLVVDPVEVIGTGAGAEPPSSRVAGRGTSGNAKDGAEGGDGGELSSSAAAAATPGEGAAGSPSQPGGAQQQQQERQGGDGDEEAGQQAGGVGGGDGGDVGGEEQESEESAADDDADEEEDGDDDNQEEFSPDPRMRRGETACRKLRVEGAAPTVRLSRPSPPTSEALAGEEIEEVGGWKGTCLRPRRVCVSPAACWVFMEMWLHTWVADHAISLLSQDLSRSRPQSFRLPSQVFPNDPQAQRSLVFFF